MSLCRPLFSSLKKSLCYCLRVVYIYLSRTVRACFFWRVPCLSDAFSIIRPSVFFLPVIRSRISVKKISDGKSARFLFRRTMGLPIILNIFCRVAFCFLSCLICCAIAVIYSFLSFFLFFSRCSTVSFVYCLRGRMRIYRRIFVYLYELFQDVGARPGCRSSFRMFELFLDVGALPGCMSSSWMSELFLDV